jgi:hypothetical protein
MTFPAWYFIVIHDSVIVHGYCVEGISTAVTTSPLSFRLWPNTRVSLIILLFFTSTLVPQRQNDIKLHVLDDQAFLTFTFINWWHKPITAKIRRSTDHFCTCNWTRLRNYEQWQRNNNFQLLTGIRKANWIGHILRRNFLLKQVIEGKIKGELQVTRRRGRRRKKLLDDLKDRSGYSHLKEEALVRTMWRNRFGRGVGPVVRQNTQWMNEQAYITGLDMDLVLII